jgi:metallo-beta-lactamase family protein
MVKRQRLAAWLVGTVAADHILRPILDETCELTPRGVQRPSDTTEPPLPPEKLARLDWLNDVSRSILDISDALAAPADDRAREVLIRRLQRPLGGDADPPTSRAARH